MLIFKKKYNDNIFVNKIDYHLPILLHITIYVII